MVKVYLPSSAACSPATRWPAATATRASSKIVPVEDMPYMADGTPATSCSTRWRALADERRQVLEVHLGWAGKGIGQRIGDMLQQQSR